MENWKILSEDAYDSAKILHRAGKFRSSISRAYYSAYCAATYEITKYKQDFENGWKNPPHAKLPSYVMNYLPIDTRNKYEVRKFIRILRQYREDADYRPFVTITSQDARNCIRDASILHQQLWGTKFDDK